jgi:hypothetical protein
LHGIPGSRLIGRADPSSCNPEYMELIRQLRGEIVVRMRGQVATKQDDGSA